jgi:hypothetical protein
VKFCNSPPPQAHRLPSHSSRRESLMPIYLPATWSRFPNALPGQTGGNETFLSESHCFGDSSHSTLVGQRRRSGRWRGSSSDGLLCFSSRMRERWRERERRRRLGNVAHVAMEKDAGLDLGETTLFCSINHRCAHHWQSSGRSWGVHILLFS